MTLTAKVFTLKSIEPFNRLSDDELILTANIMKEKSYLNSAKIYSKDSNLYNLFIVASGDVVDDNGNSSNKIIGFDELINDNTMNTNLYSKGSTTLLVLSKAHLLTLLYESPDIIVGFLELKFGRDL